MQGLNNVALLSLFCSFQNVAKYNFVVLSSWLVSPCRPVCRRPNIFFISLKFIIIYGLCHLNCCDPFYSHNWHYLSTAITCPVPVVANAKASGKLANVYDEVNFTCTNGYRWTSGSHDPTYNDDENTADVEITRTISCTEDGSWFNLSAIGECLRKLNFCLLLKKVKIAKSFVIW